MESPKEGHLSTDKAYLQFLGSLKEKVRQTQLQAMVSVNQQLLLLYWKIGADILVRQKESKWGDKFLQQLSKDLKLSFPNMKGLSVRNLKYMRSFARAYPTFKIGQAPLAQISWYHNITLISKCPEERERLWYAAKALENGWSRNVMLHQIEGNLYERSGKSLSNFDTTLPAPQSDLAAETMKDPYIFDFLSINEKVKERELEDALVEHMSEFLLELGVGFAYIGRQVKLNIGEEEFYLDLLFYHTKLHAYVAIELKMGKFKAEYVGKMNVYLSGLDDSYKMPLDSPSIGLIICKSRDEVVAEYALRDIDKPIGISQYELSQALTKEFSSKRPSVEEMEKGLEEKK